MLDCRLHKRFACLLVFLLGAPAGVPQSNPGRSVVTSPAAVGLPSQETLYFGVEWRLVTAGKAKLSWSATPQSSPTGWQANLHLESAGLVSKLFKVNDDYSVNLTGGLCATSSHMIAREGKRERETKVTFDREKKKASYLETDLLKNSAVAATHEIDIPGCVHDVVGGLYFLRTLNLEPGQSAQVPVSDGKKSIMVKVECQRREEVKTASGKRKTMVYEVFLFNNVLYRRPGHLYLWLTDDRLRVPVQIRVRLQFAIGTINFQLEKEERT